MYFTSKEESTAMAVSIKCITANVLLGLGKLAVGFTAQSAAMISDGIHSVSDIFGTLIVMTGIKFSHKASDKEHQYGHERMECVAAIILSVILAMIALGIGSSGLDNILDPEATPAIPGQMALWAALVSIAIKEGMFWYIRHTARKIDSGSLLAEAWHQRSDALSSVGSFIGIAGARMGYPILDPLASLLICLMILYAAYEIFADAMKKMVDRSTDEATAAAISALITRVPGVMHLDSLSTRLFGNRIYADVEISVRDELTLMEAHHIAETVHAAIEANFPQVKHCMVHVNPAGEVSHKSCPVLPPELLPPRGLEG